VLGRLDLRYAHAIETFPFALSAADATAARTRGLTLRLIGPGAPLWFFGGTNAPTDTATRPRSPCPPNFNRTS
jgi:hypothetical protein